MPIDRKKWGIKTAIPKTEKPDLELELDRMVTMKSPCCVCGAEMTLQAHEGFAQVNHSGHLGKIDPSLKSGAATAIQKAVEHIKAHTACEWCATARNDYDASKEAIGNVIEWIGRNYDGVKREWRVDQEKQQRMGKILHSWTKKWSDALRRMNYSQTLVWSHDIARIIWIRPRAAFTFMAKMEDFLYTEGMPESQQIKQISNILKWMKGQEAELV